MIRSVVRGVGSALPSRIMKNADFEGMVETSDAWIAQRTGIRQRHIAGDQDTVSYMASCAAQQAGSDCSLGLEAFLCLSSIICPVDSCGTVAENEG